MSQGEVDERQPIDVVAVDVGGTKIAAALVRVGGGGSKPSVRFVHRVPTQAHLGSAAVMRGIMGVIQGVMDDVASVVAGADADAGAVAAAKAGNAESSTAATTPVTPEIRGIGISSAGVIGTDGSVVSATDLIRGWAGTPLAARVKERFDMPVVALNDVHAHALGEVLWGAGATVSTSAGVRVGAGAHAAESAPQGGAMLLAAVGTGIGGAVCVEGRVLRGAHGLGGHVGHVIAPAAAGRRCSCGRFGHVESVASGSGIIAEYVRVCAASGRSVAAGIDGGEIARKATAGEREAAVVIRTAGMSLGRALGSLANVVDPDSVVLSVSVTKAGDLWWRSLREGFAESAMDVAATIPLVHGELGDEAPLIGAAEAFVRTSGVCGVPKGIWVEDAR